MSVENSGTYFNLDALKDRAGAIYTGDDEGTEDSDRDPAAWGTRAAYKGEEGFAVIDNMFVPLVPTDPHWQLGDHDREEIWHFQLANNAIIVRAHPFAPRHATMPYSMAEAAPVTYRLWNPGSAEKLDAPQRMTDWLWNTRVQEIRLALNKAGLTHPALVNIMDIIDPNPAGIVRVDDEIADLIKSGQPALLDSVYREFNTQDNTRSHLEMISVMMDFTQRLMATNEPVSSMPTQGDKTLGEVQQMFASASGRIADVFQLIEAQAFAPLAERLASDMVQFLDGPIVAQMVGDEEYRRVFGEVDFLTVEPSMLSGAYRYQVSDGTLPPDPLRNADAAMKLMELGLQGAPVNLPVLLGLIARGLGLRNTSELIQLPPAAVAGPPAVMDQGTIDQQVQQGNMVPAGGAVQ